QFAFCLQFKAVTFGDVDVFTEAAAAALNYDLPNNTRAVGYFTQSDHRPTPALGRSHRNQLYSKVEALLEAYPEGGYDDEEPKYQWSYLAAYKAGVRNQNCQDLFKKCPVSLLGLILGLRPLT
ncbi:hypothetical protein AAG570_002490, partial [Ranatra chinensis]